MNIQLAKDVIFKSEKIRPVLETMDDGTKDVFFMHFYNYPTLFSFTRTIDNVQVKKTIKGYISILPINKDGVDRLIELFFSWKEHFDGFEKKVLNILSENPGPEHYLFLRSSIFINNRELWEKDGIENSESKIVASYYDDYQNRHWRANESLGKYYLIKDNYDSKILANKFTHQLYNLIKTMYVSGFASGEGFSLVPLMINYEDVYVTPIEEHEVWDGKI